MKVRKVLMLLVVVGLLASLTHLFSTFRSPSEGELASESALPREAEPMAESLKQPLPATFSSSSDSAMESAADAPKKVKAVVISNAADYFASVEAELGDSLGTRVVASALIDACSEAFQPLLDPKDPLRAWAIDELRSICGGLDVEALRAKFRKARSRQIGDPLSETDLHALFNSDPMEAERLAAFQLAAFEDVHAVESAASFLAEVNGDEFSGGAYPQLASLSEPDRIRAVLFATDLYICNNSGGCGPNSLYTLSYCARAGCPAGADIYHALQSSLPARDFRAVEAALGWLMRLSARPG